jgi:hypothetical protein
MGEQLSRRGNSSIEQAFGRVPGINAIVLNRVMTSATLKAVVEGGLLSFGIDVVYEYLNPNLVRYDTVMLC